MFVQVGGIQQKVCSAPQCVFPFLLDWMTVRAQKFQACRKMRQTFPCLTAVDPVFVACFICRPLISYWIVEMILETGRCFRRFCKVIQHRDPPFHPAFITMQTEGQCAPGETQGLSHPAIKKAGLPVIDIAFFRCGSDPVKAGSVGHVLPAVVHCVGFECNDFIQCQDRIFFGLIKFHALIDQRCKSSAFCGTGGKIKRECFPDRFSFFQVQITETGQGVESILCAVKHIPFLSERHDTAQAQQIKCSIIPSGQPQRPSLTGWCL